MTMVITPSYKVPSRSNKSGMRTQTQHVSPLTFRKLGTHAEHILYFFNHDYIELGIYLPFI